MAVPAARNAIMVAATRQHTGKTTACLAFVAGLLARKRRVGFLKPVGQRHVTATDSEGNSLRVDKDCRLFKEYFGLDTCDYADMSPVVIPRGYTQRFLQVACPSAQPSRVSAAART